MGRPVGGGEPDHVRVATRAGDLVGRCPVCHLLYPADCVPGRCMARVNVWEQLGGIRLLFAAMNQNEDTQERYARKNDADNLARREKRARERAEREELELEDAAG